MLDPANEVNLGRNTVGFAGAPTGTDLLAVNLTLGSSGSTPLGVYTIAPLQPGTVSTITDTAINDYPMTGSFVIVVGQTLTVTKSGAGTGTVVADSGAISCGATCSDIYPGTTVLLTATPSAGSAFTGWSGGGCSGTAPCSVTVDAAKTVNANFVPRFALNVNKTGAGTGVVTSSPGAINCGATCTDTFDAGTLVTLTAVADPTFVFAGWSGGGCTGTAPCPVTVNAATTVTATFAPTFSVTVNKTGSGNGTVTGNVGGLDCGATCSVSYPSGTVVTLSAAADGSSAFTGWSGAGCSGTSTCVVTVDAAKSVTANFVAKYLLTVNKNGGGTGTVTSNVGGINCGATCTASFNDGSVVILTGAASAGSVFTGWSGGGCSGTAPCSVTMSAATTVTATFTPQFTLTVAKSGNGTGTVTSDVGGISCGVTCAANYTSGTNVTLTAVAGGGGSVFNGWSGGGCSGTAPCVVTVSAATTVTANFTDSSPPATNLLTMPPNPSDQPQVTFTFSSSEPGTFECSIDGSAFVACASPASYPVGNGDHTFTVRARDLAGNVDPEPPTYAWTTAGIVVNVAIPTLSEWMLVLLALLLGAFGMQAHRRRG